MENKETIISVEDLPHPALLPYFKNSFTLGKNVVASILRLEKKYGTPFQIILPHRRIVFLSSPELISELCKSENFEKYLGTILIELRRFMHDALVTAKNDEPNWSKANTILAPQFTPNNINHFLTGIVQANTNLINRWDRFPIGKEFDVVPELSKLSLEVISLAGFSYPIDILSSLNAHPFEKAITDVSKECLYRSYISNFHKRLRKKTDRMFKKNVDILYAYVDKILEERKNFPEKYQHTRDLL